MSTVRYVFAVLLMIGLPPALFMWFVVHPFIGFWRRLGAKPALAINMTWMVSAMIGLWYVRAPLLGADLGTHWPLVAVGIGLGAVSFRIAMARKKFLTFRILAGMPEFASAAEEQGTLLSEGIYSRIRHPRYVEIVFATFAYAFIANYVGVYILALLTPPVIHLVVLMEERELRDRFGEEYEAYSARVPRYIPRAAR